MPPSDAPRSHVRPKNAVKNAIKTPEVPGVGPHHARHVRSHRWIRGIGMVLTAVLAFVGTGAGAVWMQSTANINTININGLVTPLATPSPTSNDPKDPFAGVPLNILVMGTDYRDEENIAIAGDDGGGGMRSDTTFLVHISGDRSWAEVISFPRDALVSVPSCQIASGGESKPKKGVMFNSAFDTGAGKITDPDASLGYAAACTINTVQELTGIPVSNFVILKMTGVIDVVNAMDGVTMCFDEPVVGSRKYSPGLNLPAGQYTLNGHEAIEFVRARKGKGMGLEDGSDLKRIERQQAFIDSMMTQMLTGDVVTDAPRLYGMLQGVLSSMITDEGLGNLSNDIGLAFTLGTKLDTSKIVFTPLPVATAPSDANRVVFTSGADAIWARIAADQPPESIAPAPASPDPVGSQAEDPAAPADPAADASGEGADPVPSTEPEAGGVETPAPVEPEHLTGVCYEGWEPPSS